ncbi:hypothetical protein HED54_14770 [Ochrobactrum anthropi ATCC 49188]|nr:hypothetical protein [Brucella anthropi ATCC 49188]NKC48983.1 hypothetical protein [Brucella anthropi ATCC 49188]
MTIPEQAVQAAANAAHEELLSMAKQMNVPMEYTQSISVNNYRVMRTALTAAFPHLAAVRVKKLNEILRELITEQSEGEWDEATIENDVQNFSARILSALETSVAQPDPWVDTRLIRFDDTIVFGRGGFDFDRWESLRWEMHTRHGSFAVWKSDSKTWSMYGGKYGFLMLDRFSSEEEAKAEAEQIVVSLDAEPSAAPELAVSSGDIVDALFKDLRGRRFLKWLFSDRGDDCLIDVFRGGDELRGLDHEVQQEIRKAWEAIIERALHPVADKPDEAGREGSATAIPCRMDGSRE